MVAYQVAVTSEPWTLPIDGLVMSVGANLGALAASYDSRFPQSGLRASGFDNATPGAPVLFELRDPEAGGTGPWLAVLASAHAPFGPPTLESITEATAAAVAAASERGVQRLGMPMLATGNLAEPFHRVAAAAVPAALTAAGDSALELVFFAQSESDADMLRAAAEGRLPVPTSLRPAPRPPGRPGLAGGISSDYVDSRAGIDLGRDTLGVAPYVSMLAAALVDPKTDVPLSIGIFGEWGSGKSFFMGLLRDHVDRLARAGGGSSYTEIAQISFNAWHYADTNIWASLGDEIFRQLLGPEPGVADRRGELRRALNARLAQRREFEALTERAGAAAAEVRGQVDRAARARTAGVRDLLYALKGSQTLERRADALWRRLGITDEAEQIRVLAEQLHGSLTEADALRRSWSARAGRRTLVAAGVLLAGFAVLAAAAPQIRAWAAGCAVTVAGLCSAGAALCARARSGLRDLRLFAQDLRHGAAAAPETRTRDLTEALEKLRRAEAAQRVAEAQLDEVVAHIGELGRRLAELEPGRRLYSFLAERIASETYARNLGLVSVIRKDFEQLVALIDDAHEQHRAQAGAQAPPDEPRARPVERIILYIDDLDRCGPREVADVLQAVHLLLALDLFVVVLGVDSRWLLNSLSERYRAQLDDAADASGAGRATPEDYLEKIINIPVALPRMPQGALGRMASALAVVEAETDADPDASAGVDPWTGQGAGAGDGSGAGNGSGDDEAVSRPIPGARNSGSSPASALFAAATASTATPSTAAAATASGAGGPAYGTGSLLVEAGSEIAQRHDPAVPTVSLRPLTSAEVVLLGRLDSFTETPREAKRLINIYRMLRSTRDLTGTSRFLGEDGSPGDYQAVVVLLGILSFRPRMLDQVLDAPRHPSAGIEGGLLSRDPDGSWTDFVEDLRPSEGRNRAVGELAPESASDWDRLYASLVTLSAGLDLTDLSTLQQWARHVRRFSYRVPPRSATVL